MITNSLNSTLPYMYMYTCMYHSICIICMVLLYFTVWYCCVSLYGTVVFHLVAPGVPYQVSLWPVNGAGPGSSQHLLFFVQEIGKGHMLMYHHYY